MAQNWPCVDVEEVTRDGQQVGDRLGYTTVEFPTVAET